MVSERPKVEPTGRYSIGQASALLGVHRNTLGRWTRSGLIRCGLRKNNYRKYYTGVEILRFWSQN